MSTSLRVALILMLTVIIGGGVGFIFWRDNSFPTQAIEVTPAYVDFNAYADLVEEVKTHRESRLITATEFAGLSKQQTVIILDTRSDAMYEQKHIKGAVHLNFSDFTQENLARVIPDKNTTILIYCNNNFADDPVNFTTKSYQPRANEQGREITLALNIPTYINLYGYGYRNIFELKELVSVNDQRLTLEGVAVK